VVILKRRKKLMIRQQLGEKRHTLMNLLKKNHVIKHGRLLVSKAKSVGAKVKKVKSELVAVKAYHKAKNVTDKASERANSRLKAAVAKLPK
jgi:hypothetical protein